MIKDVIGTALKEKRRSPPLPSFHQPVLNLIKTPGHRDEIAHLLLLLRLGNLLQERGLLIGLVIEGHPPLGLIAILQGREGTSASVPL